ncbi:MAG: PAS domain S-box protein [Magnetococcales bacterium]|nr:PAS domain S-box protein [Magnetococcales bacterium]
MMTEKLSAHLRQIWLRMADRLFSITLRKTLMARYLVAVVLMALALVFRLLMAPISAGIQYITFFPAVLLSSIYGGYQAGLFAITLGLVMATYIFTPPYYTISIAVLEASLWSNIVFLIDGLIMTTAIEAMHRYREKSAAELKLVKKINEKLRVSEERLRLTARSGNIGLWDWDLRTDKVRFSREWKHQIGYADHEISNDFSEWQKRVHPDDLQWVSDIIRVYIKNPWPDYWVEFRFRHKNGDYRWILSQASIELDAAGNPIHMLGSHIDITDRKLSELHKAESLSLLNATLESSKDAIHVVTQENTWVLNNRNFIQMWQIPKEIIATKDYVAARSVIQDQLTNPDTFLKQVEELHANPEQNSSDTLTLKNGRTIECYSIPQRIDGKVVGQVWSFHDVTDKTMAEARLRESEELFRTLAESIPQIVWMAQPDGRHLYFNPQWWSYTGMNPDESHDSGWSIPFHPDDKQRALEAWREATQTDGVYTQECRLRRHDGVYRWWLIRGNAIRDSTGRTVKWVGSCTDIEDIKQAELVLHQHKAAIDLVHDGFWITDEQGYLLQANRAYAEMSGYSLAELPGKHVSDLDALDEPEDVQARIEKIIRSGWEVFETRHRRKDGREYFIEVSTSFIPESRQCVAFLRDISELKRNEQFLKNLADNIPGLVGYWTDEMRCTFSNKAYQEWFNKSQEEMRGIHIREMMGEALYQRNKPLIRGVLKGEPKQFERTLTHSDGTLHHIVAHYIPDFDDERTCGFFVYAVDVTELKLVQLQLEQTNKLLLTRTTEAESASQAKSDFVSNVSHEIRTPMNGIIGLTNLALKQKLSPRLQDYLQKIRTTSTGLLSIINDILDFAKIESGHLELDLNPFNLEELIESTIVLFNLNAEDQEVELFMFISPDTPLMLTGDGARLGQVINNLVGNAVKFTESGEIALRVTPLAVGPDFATLQFSVRDTGIGISAAQLSSLFTPFTQAERSISRRFGGTGLGLTISKRIVETMGGSIRVESEPGLGSTFHFEVRFPLSLQIRPTRPALQGKRTLVVDDRETSRNNLKEWLSRWNFDVTLAASGEEALSLLLRSTKPGETFELALIDWKMPGMDGVELAKRIEAETETHQPSRLPLILMTSDFGRDDFLRRMSGTRFEATLSKPVSESSLYRCIAHLQGLRTKGATQHSVMDTSGLVRHIRGARILLVEDNSVNQQVEREILDNAGFRVEVVNNGQRALEALNRGDFDAVLMDLQMPVMDGLTATRKIRKNPRWAFLPIIAMTAAVMADEIAECLTAGMNDHVAKPITPLALMTVLARWIRLGHHSDESNTFSQTDADQTLQLPDALPGLAIREALATISGNRTLLVRVMGHFRETFTLAAEEMRSLLETGALDKARELAHQIRGSAGNISAKGLYSAATVLEQEIQAKGGRVNLEPFNAELAQVLDSISRLPITEPSALPNPECSKCRCQESQDQFAELNWLMNDNAYIPDELIDDLKEKIKCSDLHRHLDALKRHLDNYNYPKALAHLNKMVCPQGYKLPVKPK